MKCSACGRSFNKADPINAVSTGAIYWSKIALAAVVVLFAATNNSMVTACVIAAAV